MFNHVPLDVAFSLGETERAGWGIIFQEFHGKKFDFNRMEFEAPQ